MRMCLLKLFIESSALLIFLNNPTYSQLVKPEEEVLRKRYVNQHFLFFQQFLFSCQRT